MRAKSEAGQQPELSQGTRKLSELSAGVENRPNFLQRVAQAFAWTRTTHPRRPSARHLPRPSPRLLAAARGLGAPESAQLGRLATRRLCFIAWLC